MTLAIAFGIAILGASGAGDGADGSTEQWDGIPPTSQSYEACRDALRAWVVELLDALAEKGKRR